MYLQIGYFCPTAIVCYLEIYVYLSYDGKSLEDFNDNGQNRKCNFLTKRKLSVYSRYNWKVKRCLKERTIARSSDDENIYDRIVTIPMMADDGPCPDYESDDDRGNKGQHTRSLHILCISVLRNTYIIYNFLVQFNEREKKKHERNVRDSMTWHLAENWSIGLSVRKNESCQSRITLRSLKQWKQYIQMNEKTLLFRIC